LLRPELLIDPAQYKRNEAIPRKFSGVWLPTRRA
jgi:hypothetical protein